MAKALSKFAFLLAFLIVAPVLASNSGITYQGRILRPDGSPLSGSTTQFKLQIRTPDSQDCLMYEEIQTQNMSQSNGAFALTINDGTGARTDTSGLTLDRIFANRGTFTLPVGTCQTGTGSYAPNPSDGRNFVVLFKDETMATWEPIPAQKINFVPLAFETKQIAGFTADSLLRVVNGSGDPLTGLAPLSNAQYTELMALVNGTSTAFTKSGQLGGVALPSMATGEVLGWNGSAWVSQPAVAGPNSVTTSMIQNAAVDSTKIASGAVGTSQIASNVSIATSGTLASAITTTRDFKIFAASPSTFNIDMQAPALTASYSLVWPMDDGNNGEVLTTNGSGVLSWAPASAPSQWTTQAPGINYMAGNVGIGTTSPSNPLEVAGRIKAGVLSGAYTPVMLLQNTYPTQVAGFGANLSFLGASNGNMGNIGAQYESGTNNAALVFQTALSNTNSEVMRITSAGNVGIGTTSPNAKLNLATTGATNALTINGNLGTTLFVDSYANMFFVGGMAANFDSALGLSRLDGNGEHLALETTTAGKNILLLPAAGGKIGIGTTSPTALLHVRAGTATAGTAPIKFTSGPLLSTPEDGAMEYNSASGLWFTIGSTRYVIPTNTAAGNYSNVSTISNSGGSITMTPAAGNSVIVNQSTVSTSSTTGALIVNGGVGVAGALNTAGNIFAGGSLTATTNAVIPQLYGSTAASGDIRIDGTSNATPGNVYLASAGGRVGIGTTSPVGFFDVQAGTAAASANGIDINLVAQNGGTGTTAGGNILLQAGKATGSAFGANAGTVTLKGGQRTYSSGLGGKVSLQGGAGVSGVAGGDVQLLGGTSPNGAGGGVFMATGNGAGSSNGGGILSISTGSGGSNAPGGTVLLSTGGGSGTGQGGDITVLSGGGGSSGNGGKSRSKRDRADQLQVMAEVSCSTPVRQRAARLATSFFQP